MSTFDLLESPRSDAPSGPRRHSLLPAVVAVYRLWRARQKARRELAGLDPHLLRDIGLPPEIVDFEARQPPWRPLRDWRDLRRGRGATWSGDSLLGSE